MVKWEITPARDPEQHFLNSLGCRKFVLALWLWNPGRGIVAMKSWFWNLAFGILSVECVLWKLGCRILAVASGREGLMEGRGIMKQQSW